MCRLLRDEVCESKTCVLPRSIRVCYSVRSLPDLARHFTTDRKQMFGVIPNSKERWLENDERDGTRLAEPSIGPAPTSVFPTASPSLNTATATAAVTATNGDRNRLSIVGLSIGEAELHTIQRVLMMS